MTASSITSLPLDPAAPPPGPPRYRLTARPQALAALDTETSRASAGTDLQVQPGQAAWLPAHAIAAITCLQGCVMLEIATGIAADPHAPPLRLAAGEPPWQVATPPSAWLRLQPWPGGSAACELRLQGRAGRSMPARMAGAVAQWIGWSAPD